MIYLNLFENISNMINDPITGRVIEEKFSNLYRSTRLVSAIQEVTSASPVFKDAIESLNAAIDTKEASTFTKEYELFYNKVMIISDEIALTLKKEADLIQDVEIPLITKGNVEEMPSLISSRIFVGNSMLLMFTSNEELLYKTLKFYERPTLKKNVIKEVTSA